MTFLQQNWQTLSIVAWWLFSSAMSQMPPLPQNAGFFTRWIHDFFQFIAANPAKFSTRTVTTPVGPGKEPNAIQP